jgi:hypothetical protein
MAVFPPPSSALPSSWSPPEASSSLPALLARHDLAGQGPLPPIDGRSSEQSHRARALIDGHEVFISTTILVEAEWVLRSAYGYPPPQVSEALRALAGLPRVTLEDPALAATALNWVTGG